MLWTHCPLPGKPSALPLRYLPSQGKETPGQAASLFPLLLTGSSFCVALTIRGGGREGRKTLASGRRGNRATHEDAGLRESQENQEGVIGEEENVNKLGH